MEIKKITQEDIKAIAKPYMETFNGAPWLDQWTIDTAVESLSDNFNMPKAVAFFAVNESGEVMGAVFGRVETYSNTKTFNVKEMFVHPTHQHKGVATALFTAAVEEAKSRGAQGAFLSTQKDIPAYEFYKKMGLHKLANGVLMYGRV